MSFISVAKGPIMNQIGLPIRSRVLFQYSTRLFSGSSGRLDEKADSVRDQLYEAVRANDSADKPNKRSLDDSLFEVLSNLDAKPISENNLHDDLGLGNSSQMHPRDIAKNIRINGPQAGRTVDVSSGAVSYGLRGINTIIRSNKIRYLQRVQNRFIPPGKYKKQLKREWWRRRFFQGFKGLMAQVNDAKRRGY